ncbi:ATP-binding protein [Candidatus Woesearchaeota archaeon]|nr:ATP-binding protein [Candidatus Woesearchaeota archaeon]
MAQFVLEWEKALGWKDNPFQDKIFEPVENFIVGYEKERQKLNLFVIENYRYGIVLGDDGSGKTTLLRWMRSQLIHYRQRFAVLYLNAKNLKTEQEFIKALVSPFLNPIEQYVTRPWKKIHIGNMVEFLKPRLAGKNMILLLDEAQALPKAELLILKHLFDSTVHMQLIVAGPVEEMKQSIVSTFSEDKLGITLHGLKQDDIKEMLTRRIEALGGKGIDPFDHDLLSHIARNPNNNPKEVLIVCNDHAVKLALKHNFSKKDKKPIPDKEKLFMIENVEADEKEEGKPITDIFLPGLLDQPEKKEAQPPASGIQMTDDIIQQAAAEIKEAAKQEPRRFGRKKSH